MPSVTGYTAARMKEIEDNSVVGGAVVAGNLILTKFNGEQINAGSVVGPQGPAGPAGPVPEALANGKFYARKDAAWADLTDFINKAQAAAQGFIEELSDPTDRDMTTIGAIIRSTGATIVLNNSDSIARNYLLRMDARIQSDSGGLYRAHVYDDTANGPIGDQMQIGIEGGGASNAEDVAAEARVVLTPGQTREYCPSMLKVAGADATILVAGLVAFDMGGILA